MNTQIEPDCLADWLEENKKEIDWVSLEWSWNATIEIESNFVGTYYGGKDIPLYHRFSAQRIDYEYCYEGDVEGAIEFAKNYGCWDGKTLDFCNGIVIGREDAWDPDADEFPDNGKDLAESMDFYDITYHGLYYYTRDSKNNSTVLWFSSGKLREGYTIKRVD